MTIDKTTDLMVVKQQENAVEALASDMFKDIDFTGLNRTIDLIGNKSANLNPDEKVAATESTISETEVSSTRTNYHALCC